MTIRVDELIETDSVDEANKLLSSGWLLLKHDSAVIDGKPQYFFLLGKKAKTSLEKLVDQLDPQHQE